jgi:nucleoid-associated protein YgaU/DNA-binding SARP family transcriptional activator
MPRPYRGSRAAATARSMAALLLLAAVIVGTPMALLAIGAQPIPQHIPTPTELCQRLTQKDDGTLLIGFLTVTTWLAWATFTALSAFDLAAATRGKAIPRLPGLRLFQEPITALVAAAALLFVSVPRPAHALPPPLAAQPPPRPDSHAAASTPGGAAPAGRATWSEASPPHAKLPVYTVRPRDTLWRIAERHLGNGLRYHEIAALNADRIQHGGHRLTDDHIEPGWTLILPADATGIATEPATNQPNHTGATKTVPATVIVRPPVNGTHDTLWRIAARELGNGARWPEIWALNHNHRESGGAVFSNPNLIQPGWVLRLPEHIALPTRPRSEHGRPHPDRPAAPTTSTGTPNAPPADQPTRRPSATPAPAETHRPRANPGATASTPTGAYLGIGLAALITTALITVRLARRRHYRPGSGRRDEPPAPIVRALRLAHDQETLPTNGDGDPPPSEPPDTPARRETTTRTRARDTANAVLPPDKTVLAVRDGQPIALDLATTRGLGLIGPGALTAARALLVGLLARAQQGVDTGDVEVVVPAPDVPTLIGSAALRHPPVRLRIVADLDAALALMEAELLTRVRHASSGVHHHTTLLLLATPRAQDGQRLQNLLDNGSTLGLAGLLLGPWQPGATAKINADGTVAAASPELSAALTRSRLFTLPAADATELLDLLGTVDELTLDDPPDHAPQPRQPHRIPQHDDAHNANNQDPRVPNRPARQSTSERHRPRGSPSDRRSGSQAAHHPAQPPTASGQTDRLPTMDAADTTDAESTAEDDDTNAEPTTRTQQGQARPASRPVGTPEQRNTDANTEQAGQAANLAVTETQSAVTIDLAVLGRIRLSRRDNRHSHDENLITHLAPKQREILLYLAIHPDGTRRDTLTATLWPNAQTSRPANTFHATMSQMRRALQAATDHQLADLTLNHDGRYTLNNDLVAVDLWHLHHHLDTAHERHTDQQQVAAQHVINLYRGDLAEELTAEWLEAPRESLRRDVLDFLSAASRNIRPDDPDQALKILERARQLDPYNEPIYHDIAHTQAQLGHHAAVKRTLALLATHLAELDEKPSPATIALFHQLQQPTRPGQT